MIYADYDYYADTYLGKMSAEDYERLCRQASAYIDNATRDKASSASGSTLIKVKDACCQICDILLKDEQGGDIASESNDGISITYSIAQAKTKEQKIREVINLYLGNTGLITRWC